MQKTRLNLLLAQTTTRIDIFFINPWRRISLILISFLLGMVMGTAIPTTAGQSSAIDIIVASFLLFFTEVVSLYVYGRQKNNINQKNNNSTFIFVLNSFKIGLTLGLYLEAVKLAT
jgi:hypothetical protein